MKSSVNKGFLSYLLMFLLIIVAIVLVMGAIMLLSPEVQILGYQYVSTSNTINVTSYNGTDKFKNLETDLLLVNNAGEKLTKLEEGANFINFKQLQKLVIKTNTMDVNIIYGEEDRIEIVRSVSGFTKVGSVEKLVATKNINANVFTITALDTVPSLPLSNKSKINVHLKERTTSNLALEIETDSANLNVSTFAFNATTSTDLTLKSVDYTTKTGNLTLSSTATISEKINVDSEKDSNILIGKNQVLNSNFNLKFNKGFVKIQNITAPSATFGGESVVVEGKDLTLTTGLTLNIKRGDLLLNKVSGFVLDENDTAENLLVKIKEVTGDFTMNKLEAKNGNKSNIEIEEVKGKVLIIASSGNVKINKATKEVYIETISGSINLQDFNNLSSPTERFFLKTDSGNIFVGVSYLRNTNTATSTKGNVEFNYLNTLNNFEINVSTKNKKSISFSPLNETYEELLVVGYPTPMDEPLSESNTNKVIIYAGKKAKISAV